MGRHWKWFFIVPAAIVGMIVAGSGLVALGGWAVMSLWNWLMPGLFGLPVVTFWQALGLLALSRILFGGFRLGGGGGGPLPASGHPLV